MHDLIPPRKKDMHGLMRWHALHGYICKIVTYEYDLRMSHNLVDQMATND